MSLNLDANSRLTKWFVWSCDHLSLTAGWNEKERPRPGSYYVLNGTTLCHIFWSVLWLPLLLATIGTFFLSLFVMLHIQAHFEFVTTHPSYNPVVLAASYFIPELFAVGIGLALAILILAFVGGAKVGFFALLWQYLRGMKQRICPLVHFDGARMEAAE